MVAPAKAPQEQTDPAHYERLLKRLKAIHEKVRSYQLEMGRLILHELAEHADASVRRLARDLGIKPATLDRWICAARAAAALEKRVPSVGRLGIVGLEALWRVPDACARTKLAKKAVERGWGPTELRRNAKRLHSDAENFDPEEPVVIQVDPLPSEQERRRVLVLIAGLRDLRAEHDRDDFVRRLIQDIQTEFVAKKLRIVEVAR